MRNSWLFLRGSQKGSEKRAERKQMILDILVDNLTITKTQLMDERNLTR